MRAGRIVLLLLLLRWTWMFLAWPMREDVIGASFLHLINLPFHEAGHILFLPFGEFMTTLGGSLTQTAYALLSDLVTIRRRQLPAPPGASAGRTP